MASEDDSGYGSCLPIVSAHNCIIISITGSIVNSELSVRPLFDSLLCWLYWHETPYL